MSKGGKAYGAYEAFRRSLLPLHPPPDNKPTIPDTSAEIYNILMDPDRVPLLKWQYKATKEWHLGPTAGQWWDATGLGRNERTIFATDAAFAVLAALRHSEVLREQLSKQLETLEKRLAKLESKKSTNKNSKNK